MDFLAQVDSGLLEAVEGIRSPVLNAVMIFITHLGDVGFIWIVIGVILFGTKRYRKCGLAILLSLLCSLLFTNVLIKNLVARPRPFTVLAVEPLVSETSWSFPSGHTSASFAAAVAGLLLLKKKGIPFLLLAVLIAFSRLYLQVHYPSDILGGMLIGSLCGVLGVMLMKRIVKRYDIRRKS